MAGFGVNVAVTPSGSPSARNEIGPLEPFRRPIVIGSVTVASCSSTNFVPAGLRVKSGAGAGSGTPKVRSSIAIGFESSVAALPEISNPTIVADGAETESSEWIPAPRVTRTDEAATGLPFRSKARRLTTAHPLAVGSIAVQIAESPEIPDADRDPARGGRPTCRSSWG